MSEVAIRSIDVVRDFGTVRALDHLSFEIPKGIVFGFLGPNGAGKTTAIRMLLGLVQPTSGRAEVLGRDSWSEGSAVRERSGALLEHAGLYERLSAEQNLDFFGRAWRIPRHQRRERTRALLEQFGLWERRKDLVGTWSRGMKQKLAVARTVLHRPSLVFLDEPTAGLDPVASASLREDLAALSTHEGTTIFLTTHNLAEAERLCTLVGVIRKGRLVALGSPTELRRDRSNDVRLVVTANPALLESLGPALGVRAVRRDDRAWMLSLEPGVSPAPIVRWLVERGAEIEECTRMSASLEDVFLDLVSDDREDG
ncbi:MAG: Daunorubicin/doxorubicin resistance ATP-binding protein DrrA [Gemmatimonadaceae bacterium]|nr:Daunorubicin/doxorubicin resistance ATP-binding protein DrrA [Gemmatimonadaceae bacterium]